MHLLTKNKTITITSWADKSLSSIKGLSKWETLQSSLISHFYVQWNCIDADEFSKDNSFHGGVHVKCHFLCDNSKIVLKLQKLSQLPGNFKEIWTIIIS